MRDYFIRRFLLIPLALLGVTILVFGLTRLAPGGPIEQAMMRAQSSEMGGAAGRDINRGALSEDQLAALKAYYGYDKPVHIAYLTWLGRVVRGDLGNSFRYGEPVREVILQRIPISIAYGAISLVLIYSICVPLGVLKAIKHRTFIDSGSSIMIFIGYGIPSYALGALVVVFLAARAEWFPMGGFVSDDFEDFGFFEKIRDFSHHAALPLLCYTIGGFAFLTMLVKNQLMDNLAADYVRTAVAKGVTFRAAVFRHAFRNSLIPVATNLGHAFGALVSGSFLIEFIFDIDGMGLLGYNSVVDRDTNVVMGVLLLSSVILMLGNILADFLVALADPRVRFK